MQYYMKLRVTPKDFMLLMDGMNVLKEHLIVMEANMIPVSKEADAKFIENLTKKKEDIDKIVNRLVESLNQAEIEGYFR